MAFSGNVILGVTGSISAYKSAYIARLLVKQGCNVKVVLTTGGAQFITPLTLSTVSKNAVLTDFANAQTGEWHNHVALANWANLILVSPMSANTLGKLANGLCDNLLHAIYLSAKNKVLLCPAMDHDMWNHKATQRNIDLVKQDGAIILPPESGELASGLIGDGRLPEPENIVAFINSNL